MESNKYIQSDKPVSPKTVHYCWECGGEIDDLSKSRKCGICGKLFHLDTSPIGKICGFSTASSLECKSCIYAQHGKLSVSARRKEKKLMGGMLGGLLLAIFLAATALFGISYADGDKGALQPLIIFAVASVVVLILFARDSAVS